MSAEAVSSVYINNKMHLVKGGICTMSHKINNLRRKSEGFTIIEVLIVLAIAGLIMLIVFLAIPALRRNQQNTTMRSEASRLLSAITEYESNANGQQVNSTARLTSVTTNAGTLTQLTGTGTFITAAANGTNLTSGSYQVAIGTCNGTDIVIGATGSRVYALRFGLHGGTQACIQS